MSNENENDPSQSRFAWRPATRGDIGSVARFRCKDSRVWEYGILNAISEESPFKCECSNDLGLEWRDVCEIQYDPNEEP